MEGNDELGRLIAHIPKSYVSTPELCHYCCCGNIQCHIFRQNCLAFEQLECELRIAARLGQALLARHKQFMRDVERDREEMNARQEQLEFQKKALESQNEHILETNRRLFDQQEKLNISVAQSELQIKALETTLDSTRYEFKRLQTLSVRTQHLERQLVAFERERETLQCTIWTTNDLKQKAEQRWKMAERRLVSLQEQLESIDRESKEERERHVGLLIRMNERTDTKKELGIAKGHLNDEIADLEVSKSNSKNVLSQFVQDILQDNANLQSAISELRDMLLCSNEETQMLRDQLIENRSLGGPEIRPQIPTLGAELSRKDPQNPSVISQSVHTHHHYHIPPKRRETYKFRRKSKLLGNGPNKSQRTHKSRHKLHEKEYLPVSSNSLSLFESNHVQRKGWSEQSSFFSDFASSSRPSTSHSFQRQSISFDRGFDFNSSIPTSFGSSVDLLSPKFNPPKSITEATKHITSPLLNIRDSIIQEEKDVIDDNSEFRSQEFQENFLTPKGKSINQQVLQGAASHEPIISIDGIDIHTLRSRPSQITYARQSAAVYSISRHGMPAVNFDSRTIASPSSVMARPILIPKGPKNISKNLSNVLSRCIDTCPVRGPRSPIKISNWIRENLGRGSTRPTDLLFARLTRKRIAKIKLRTQNSNKIFSPNTSLILNRCPGINQKGLVPGFVKKLKRLPCQTFPTSVDYDALHEILTEEFDSLAL